MVNLTKEQTRLIQKEILQRGISNPDLEEDLLDHICSAVEDHMASGDNFELALALVMSNFQEYELQKVQERTQALLSGKKIYYPNIPQSALLLIVFIILIFLTSILFFPIQKGDPDFYNQHAILFQSIQVCGSLLLVIMNAKLELKARSFTKVEIVPAQPFPLSILPLILCILFLYHVWMEVIISIIPVPDAIQAAINQRLPHYPALPLLLFIGILWSVLSEVLFRGIILKGLLRKYTPFQAILWSSIFFSVSLLNPYNALCVFLLGLFCGWLFYRTHSLLPSILVQILALLPGAIYISWAKPGHFEQLLIWKNLIGNQVIYYSLGLVSVLLTIFLLWWLKKLFDQKQGVAFFTTE